MSANIDESLVRSIAHLSRLELDDTEVAVMAGELAAIVEYIDHLSEADTEGLPETAHAISVVSVFRDDEVTSSYDSDKSLLNAPQREGAFFRVPKVLDTEGGA